MGKQKTNKLSRNYWVSKSNTLNEIRNSHMTISQMRLFAIYLSRINPKDKTTREVTFKLDEYTKIMKFKQTNITRLKNSADDLLKVVITFWGEQEDGEKFRAFTSCQLFKKIKLIKNEENEWIISIDCHDDILPLMFELKEYLKYELWNVLQLSSYTQQRMYELLKQYQKFGEREFYVSDLKEMLGIDPEKYSQWDNFRRRVLEPSQKALANYTDIKFTWKVGRGKGKGGKINSIKFFIEKNEDYERQFTFDEYIAEQNNPHIADDIEEFEHTSNDIISFLSEACDNEFNREEIAVLHTLLVKIIHFSIRMELDMYDYLHDKYTELKWRARQTKIKNRFRYLKKIIEVEVNR